MRRKYRLDLSLTLFMVVVLLMMVPLTIAQDGEPAATEEATAEVTEEATAEATEEMTAEPTEEATAEATGEATDEPTDEPTEEATAEPTEEEATDEPTEEPTAEPTEEMTAEPTEEPTVEATAEPTTAPAIVNPVVITGETVEYIIQPGDTLFSISQRFGVSVQSIIDLNGIVNPSLIYWGTRIRIPADNADEGPGTGGPGTATPAPPDNGLTTHIVQPGDNLYRLSLRYNTTMARLMDLNGIQNPNLIFLGDELIVPRN